MKTTSPRITRIIICVVVAIVAMVSALSSILAVRNRVLKMRGLRHAAAEVLGEEEFTKIA